MACSAFSPHKPVKQNPFHVRGARYRRLGISLAEEIQTGRYGSETALPTDSELMLKYGLGVPNWVQSVSGADRGRDLVLSRPWQG